MTLRVLCVLLAAACLCCGCKRPAASPPIPTPPVVPALPGPLPPSPPPAPGPPPGAQARPAPRPPRLDTTAAASRRQFAFSLFSRLQAAQPQQNVFVSPLSVSMALHLLVNCAAGPTRAAILHTLAADAISPGAANADLLALRTWLEQADPAVKLTIADSVWTQVPVEQPFADTARRYYGAAVETLDFASPGAAGRINGWANDKTAGLIPSVIDQATLRRLTMVLLDAVYFKGRWESVFSKRDTAPRPFHLLSGREQQVPMMSQYGEFRYAEGPMGQVIRLPYGQGGLAMYVLLPEAKLGLAGAMRALDQKGWQALTAPMTRQEGTIKLPRFTARYEASLNQALTAMGMGVAFDRRKADFTALSRTHQWVDLVKHSSFLKVDEEGTEAAAVTEIGMAAGAPAGPVRPFEMIVDRPFVLLIEDRQTTTVLFMGAIVEPEKL